MARPASFDDKRALIEAIRANAPATAASELKGLLADKNGFIVGDAARAVRELEIVALVPDLEAAFFRLLRDPLPADKTCAGKNRILEALLGFDAQALDVYRAGVRHVQLEPAWGKPVDTAAGLRGLSARALVHAGSREAVAEIAPLLADVERVPRVEAARALGESGLDAAGPVLHLKALLGDADLEVLGAVLCGLLSIAPERYTVFVAEVLSEGSDDRAEAAAVALGESRVPGAFDLLRAAAETRRDRVLSAVMLALALLRRDDAREWLVAAVADGPRTAAIAAIEALALHRHDEALAARVAATVRARASKPLERVFVERFAKG